MNKLRHSNPRRVALHSVAALAAAGGLALSNAAIASASSHGHARKHAKSHAVKPDLKYFRGKQITFVTGGAPGGSFQAFAIAVAPAMGTYLHARVNVEDIQPGATVPAADASANAQPNGLTIGDGNLIQFIESFITHQSTVNYTLKAVNYIGGQGPNPMILLTNKQSGITSLQQLLSTPNVKWVLTGGEPETAELILSKAYHQTNPTYLSGYPTGAASEEGMLRGDGAVTGLTVAESVGLVQSGAAHGILLSVPVPKGTADYAQMSKIPTLTKYVAAHPGKSKTDKEALQNLINFESFPSDIVQAPAGTPMKYVLALRDAYKWAMHNKAVQNKLTFGGFSDQWIPGPTVLKDIAKVTTPQVENFMRPYLSFNG